MNSLAKTLLFLYPDGGWNLTGDTLDGLMWMRDDDAPTQADVDAAMADALTADAWRQVRVRRDEILSASDWTQVADAPVDQEAWAVYRQTLRDIPQDFANPEDVVWPEAV